jgi:hypothetical protein
MRLARSTRRAIDGGVTEQPCRRGAARLGGDDSSEYRMRTVRLLCPFLNAEEVFGGNWDAEVRG